MPYGIGAERLDPWLDLAAEANKLGFFDWRPDVDHLAWNPAAEQALGLEPGTIKSFARWSDFVPVADVEDVQRDIAEAVAARAPRLSFRYRFVVPGQTHRVFEGVGRCFYQGGALDRMVGVNIDVTERDRQQAELERREREMDAILRTVPDAIVVIDAGGTVRRVNPAAEALFGRKESMMIGKDMTGLMPLDLADLHHKGMEAYLRSGDAKVVGRSRRLFASRSDGSVVPVELSVGEVRFAGEHWFVGVLRDVTERDNARRAVDTLREQFLRAARLSTTGAMAAGLAHELNQPLTAAMNYLAAAQLSLADAVLPSSSSEHLRRAGEEIARSSEIIRRLRRHMIGEPGEPAWHNLRELVDEALALSLLREDFDALALSVDVEDGVHVCVDKVEMQQVLVNIFRNAADAMREVDTKAPRVEIVATRRGEWVDLTVTDGGPGFTPGLLAGLDTPFLTTKPGRGMGLGLSIVRRFLEARGGKIELSNDKRGGGRVLLRLPDGESDDHVRTHRSQASHS